MRRGSNLTKAGRERKSSERLWNELKRRDRVSKSRGGTSLKIRNRNSWAQKKNEDRNGAGLRRSHTSKRNKDKGKPFKCIESQTWRW